MTRSVTRPALDPDAEHFLARLKAANLPPLAEQPVSVLREQAAVVGATSDPVASVKDLSLPRGGESLVVREYRPIEQSEPLPAIMFFHGGGWVLGSIDSHDALCRRLSLKTNSVVYSVDYRLAPEHPFPAALDDSLQATQWVLENAGSLNILADKVSVCGDSAGGNLAAVVALKLRDRFALFSQILFYPVTNSDFETVSYHENADDLFLSRASMQWFWQQYAPSIQAAMSPDTSPLLAETLAGLPPTFLLTVGYDPLRDEGRAYAMRLVEAGVSTWFVERANLIHGFMRRLDDFKAVTPVLDEVALFLKTVHPRTPSASA